MFIIRVIQDTITLRGKIYKFLILQKIKILVATGRYAVKGIVQQNQLTIFFYVTSLLYEGWNFNSGNYLFTTDTK